MLPENYKRRVAIFIDELWCVWRSLGVYSEGAVVPMAPEDAIIGLCVSGRYDQRLFDEALSCIIQHSRFISKNRLLSLVKKLDNEAKKVFCIIALCLETMGNDARFSSIIRQVKKAPETPFFKYLQTDSSFAGKNQDPLFLRCGFERNVFIRSNKLRNLKYVVANNQWIRAKLFFGNTARADTVMELVCNKSRTAPAIAADTGYAQKTIWNIVTDFESAGLVTGEKKSNRIVYSLTGNGEKQFLPFNIKTKPPDISQWIAFGYYLAALDKMPENASALLIRSEEKRIEKEIHDLQKNNF